MFRTYLEWHSKHSNVYEIIGFSLFRLCSLSSRTLVNLSRYLGFFLQTLTCEPSLTPDGKLVPQNLHICGLDDNWLNCYLHSNEQNLPEPYEPLCSLPHLGFSHFIMVFTLEHETGLEPAKISHIGSVVSWPIPLTRALTRHKVCISHYSVWNTERRLEHFTGFEPALRLLEPFHWFIFSELCLPIVLGLQCCVFQRDSTILDSLVGTDVVETSLPRYQHGVITVIRSAY